MARVHQFTKFEDSNQYEEHMKRLYIGRNVGYKISWESKTTHEESRGLESSSRVYMDNAEIRGELLSTPLILTKEELIRTFNDIAYQEDIEEDTLRIHSYYLNNNNEIDTTLPYSGFKGQENINYLV